MKTIDLLEILKNTIQEETQLSLENAFNRLGGSVMSCVVQKAMRKACEETIETIIIEANLHCGLIDIHSILKLKEKII